jgi:hypothetical protein
MRLVVALLKIALVTAAGDAPGLDCSSLAAAPATCGAAIEVPLMVRIAELLVCHAEVILVPGAKILTQEPKLEKLERLSLLAVAATVIAEGTLAGEELQAFAFELPAATIKVMPRFTALVTA